MLTALFLPLAVAFSSAPAPAPAAPGLVDADADAPALAAQAFADAERVLAVHEIPGAVVFDLERAGEAFQLTVTLDDDGAVVGTAIDWTGAAAPDGGVAPGPAARLARVERIDTRGGVLTLHDGAAHARLAID